MTTDMLWTVETAHARFERLIALHAELATMSYVLAEVDGRLIVEVRGSYYEARAWRAALNGRILPSHIDVHRVRRQLVIGSWAQVQVVEYPGPPGSI